MDKLSPEIVAENRIFRIIMIIRGKKVILDSDLAKLYGVETRRLNEQVRRNINKFPSDFMFQLTNGEFNNLKSQIATSSSEWGGRRKAPLVFTEHGALQAANVLNSTQAIKMSVFIIRAFVRLREMALTNEKLSQKVEQLENRVSDHDEILVELIQEIRKLIEIPDSKGKKGVIGFISADNSDRNDEESQNKLLVGMRKKPEPQTTAEPDAGKPHVRTCKGYKYYVLPNMQG